MWVAKDVPALRSSSGAATLPHRYAETSSLSPTFDCATTRESRRWGCDNPGDESGHAEEGADTCPSAEWRFLKREWTSRVERAAPKRSMMGAEQLAHSRREA